jgi:hypothetical protein
MLTSRFSHRRRKSTTARIKLLRSHSRQKVSETNQQEASGRAKYTPRWLFKKTIIISHETIVLL